MGKGVGRGQLRSVLITVEAARAIQAHIAEANIESGARIFPISTAMVRKLLKQWLKAAGINKKGITPHQFRHFMITHMLKKGLSVDQAMQQSGHRSLSAFQQYLHNDLTRSKFDKIWN